jgi:hypothetical protein
MDGRRWKSELRSAVTQGGKLSLIIEIERTGSVVLGR